MGPLSELAAKLLVINEETSMSMTTIPATPIFSKPRAFWMHNREASRNWLAF